MTATASNRMMVDEDTVIAASRMMGCEDTVTAESRRVPADSNSTRTRSFDGIMMIKRGSSSQFSSPQATPQLHDGLISPIRLG